jgi:hypothetical protein
MIASADEDDDEDDGAVGVGVSSAAAARRDEAAVEEVEMVETVDDELDESFMGIHGCAGNRIRYRRHFLHVGRCSVSH